MPKRYKFNEVKKFIEAVEDAPGEYQLSSTGFENIDTPLSIKHIKCGTFFNMSFKKFRGTKDHYPQRCPKCTPPPKRGGKRMNIEKVREFINSIEDEEGKYELLCNVYRGPDIPLTIRHNTHSFRMSYHNFSRGSRCTQSDCYTKRVKTAQSLSIDYVRKFVSTAEDAPGLYELISSSYINNTSPIEILHKVCNKTYTTTFSIFQKGCRCTNVGCMRKKREDTMMVKYGAKDVWQVPELVEKISISAFKWKPYILPSGRRVNIQGYEYLYLDYLFNNNNIDENDIIYSSEMNKLPVIYYKYGCGEHRYFVDLFIIPFNLIVEIKSDWTYDGCGKSGYEERKYLVHLKLEIAYQSGYDTLLIVFDDNHNVLISDMKIH